MLVYFGFLAVLLITNQDKHIRQDKILISTTNDGPKYKNSLNAEIEVNSYCKSRICVLRCCPRGKDLNSDGACEDSSLINKNRLIHVYKWGDRTQEQNVTTNMKLQKALAEDDQIADFYILKHGSLNIKLKNNTDQWLGVAPLDFCVNSHVAAVMNRDNLAFITKSTEDIKEDAVTDQPDHTFKYVAAGTIVSLLLFGFIVFRMCPVLRRIFGLDGLAFLYTVIASYTTISVQLVSIQAGTISSSECRIISPFSYFFVLSTFFWLNVMAFDTWWMIRNFRKHSIKINEEVDSQKFKRLCIYGWVIPLLMTVIAVFVDALLLRLRPFFDSCLTNDTEAFIFLYIPITILTAIKVMSHLLRLYNIIRLQHLYDNLLDISKIMISKHRYGVHIRIYLIVTVSGMLELLPYIPRIIYYTIHAHNIIVGGTFYIMFWYERSTYDEVPITWYNFDEKFKELYRKATGTVTMRSTVSDVVIGDRNSDGLERRINTSDVENNRY